MHNHKFKKSALNFSEKRYLDAGAPVALPPFDYISSILCEKDSMVSRFFLTKARSSNGEFSFSEE